MEENIRSDSSKIWFGGRNYTTAELELIIDLWNLLRRIEKIEDEDKRDTAEANWFELYKAFFM